MCSAGGGKGRAEHNDLEECALMRGEDDVVGEVDLLPFGLSLLLLLLCQADTIHLGEAEPTAVVGQKRNTLFVRVPNHAFASRTHLQPAFPARNQLDGPQVPVANHAFETVGFADVVTVHNGGGEGLFELLLAFDVPASEQICVVSIIGGSGFRRGGRKGAAGDHETPGQGRGVAEAGCDSLATKRR